MKLQKKHLKILIITFSVIILISCLIFFLKGKFVFIESEFPIIILFRSVERYIDNKQPIPMEEIFTKEVLEKVNKEPFLNTSGGINPIIEAFKEANITNTGKKISRSLYVDPNGVERIVRYGITKENGEFRIANISLES